ncbi:MAG: ABC transporter ATP-binding protein [Nitrososphaerota archaeon]
MKILEIKDLHVEIMGKKILNGIDLEIEENEKIVLLGPNGSGKTTLLKAIMGLSPIKIIKGNIIFKGKDITNLSIDERAKLGIGMAFQFPPSIKGVRISDILNKFGLKKEDFDEIAKKFNFPIEFFEREINIGFSGGEMKRIECMLLYNQKPKLALIDEPDSGVDIINLGVIGKSISTLLENNCSGIIVTHQGLILNYVEVDKAYVLLNGKIACYGEPMEVLKDIGKGGYEKCEICKKF